eukprot:COSAG02_NODE_1482_length_12387_cov_6.381348_7_plen_71_part_00
MHVETGMQQASDHYWLWCTSDFKNGMQVVEEQTQEGRLPELQAHSRNPNIPVLVRYRYRCYYIVLVEESG